MAKQRRESVIRFKVTEEEEGLVEDGARRSRTNLSEYVRQAVFQRIERDKEAPWWAARKTAG